MPPIRRSTTDLEEVKAGKPYSWGSVVKVHEIGVYAVIESVRPRTDAEDTRHHMFAAYVNGKNTNISSQTLEGALVICIAHRMTGHNNTAVENARCAAKLLDIRSDY